MKSWIELFKSIGEEVYLRINKIAGSNEAKKILGKGKFGDNTVFIDKLSEDIVIKKLSDSGETCSILTEEMGWINLGSKFPTIIVDPVDGSLNAKRGIPYYSLSIGLAQGERTDDIVCGYIINLANGEEFWAIKGKGAFINNRKIKQKKAYSPIKVVAVEGLKQETDPQLIAKIFKSFYRIRQSGSTALDMCYTALGAYDAFLHLDKARIIDYSAGKIILEESGGKLFEWLSRDKFTDKISEKKSKPFLCLSKTELIEDFLTKFK